ncbi:MAG TPA: DUF935 family protein [Dongiaceae bacterium]|nr:Mu-like prophage protein gp29-like protein [Verrucomicrobiota bacterium]HXP60730.1 DUF935 family protein [Dongiaceae bacterium]
MMRALFDKTAATLTRLAGKWLARKFTNSTSRPSAVLPQALSRDLASILRPQAAYRWLLPQLSSITPKYIEMTLRGALAGSHVQAWELFDLMEDTWPRLLKNERELKTGVLNLLRTFEPFCEEDEPPTASANEKCRLVSAALRTMRPEPDADENALDGTIFDILDAWFKGQSVIEVDWEVRHLGGLGPCVAPRATYWVHPTCYAWNMKGQLGLRLELTPNITPSGTAADYSQRGAGILPANRSLNPSLSPGVWQSTTFQPLPSSVAAFPPHKFLLCTCKAKSGTALGGALLRPLAWWWCVANFSADWLLEHVQIFGMPFRWATYDPGASQATIDTVSNMLQNVGSSGWGSFPTGTRFGLIQPKIQKELAQADLLDRADKQCDLLVLGQTLTSDVGRSGKGGGGLALGKVHSGVRDDLITAAAKYVQTVLETQLFPSILRLNYGTGTDYGLGRDHGPQTTDPRPEEVPTLCLHSQKEEDQAAEATVIATLAQAGAGRIIGLDWLGKKFGIPKPAAGEETLEDHEL